MVEHGVAELFDPALPGPELGEIAEHAAVVVPVAEDTHRVVDEGLIYVAELRLAEVDRDYLVHHLLEPRLAGRPDRDGDVLVRPAGERHLARHPSGIEVREAGHLLDIVPIGVSPRLLHEDLRPIGREPAELQDAPIILEADLAHANALLDLPMLGVVGPEPLTGLELRGHPQAGVEPGPAHRVGDVAEAGELAKEAGDLLHAELFGRVERLNDGRDNPGDEPEDHRAGDHIAGHVVHRPRELAAAVDEPLFVEGDRALRNIPQEVEEHVDRLRPEPDHGPELFVGEGLIQERAEGLPFEGRPIGLLRVLVEAI